MEITISDRSNGPHLAVNLTRRELYLLAAAARYASSNEQDLHDSLYYERDPRMIELMASQNTEDHVRLISRSPHIDELHDLSNDLIKILLPKVKSPEAEVRPPDGP